MSEPEAERPEPDAPDAELGGRYAWYVLCVLVLVYVFNFVDRNIVSILAEDIKRDLGVTDAQIGFLYGTAFAVFYAIFGVPLGRLADVWVRRSLIASGLAVWSVMTALSGFAQSFVSLGGLRVGVGIGEASASPAAFSMLSDYFPVNRRATALAIYSSGVYIGAGLGVFLGGNIVGWWEGGVDPRPLGLAGWQAAYLIVGLPGLLLAVWVRSLREPLRGQSEGLRSETHPHPFVEFRRELAAVVPVFSIWPLLRAGGGARGAAINVAAGAGLALSAASCIAWLGNPAQWIALGIGLYGAFSWAQSLALRDPAAFAMIFRCRALTYTGLGFASLAFSAYGLVAFAPVFFQRVHAVSPAEVGTIVGLTVAIVGWLGATLGGVFSDWLRAHTPNARLYVGLLGTLPSAAAVAWMLLTDDLLVAYVLNGVVTFLNATWVGPAATTVNDLVLPRMRALASSYYILLVTFLGLALGPYTVGQISDSLQAAGASDASALRTAMLSILVANGVGCVLLILASRHLAGDERTRLERARAAGERGI